MMRIITGLAKGIRLDTLEGNATRPTTEIVKEAIFSQLQFDLDSRIVLDLFAGSGQMGLEALSRGASHCTFIDNSSDAIKIVKRNVEKTRLGEKSTVLLADWKAFIKKGHGDKQFNLVFVDPPYAQALTSDVFRRLISENVLGNGAIVVLESGSDEYISAEGFTIRKKQKYGKSYITILEKDA